VSIYKTDQARQDILALYDKKLASLNLDYQEIDIPTNFGKTRVVKTGNPDGKTIVLFHGFNAGSPITIDPIKEMTNDYLVYCVDTVGQTTKSEGKPLSIKDNSFGVWADEVLEGLGLDQVTCCGISYGGFILQKLIAHKPNRVAKCIFLVPAGLVNGDFLPSMKKLSFPLMKFMLFKKEKDFKSFIDAFVPADDEHMIALQRVMMYGTKLNTKIPPLLKETDVAHFTNPVYLIVAENDIFFPYKSAIERAKKVYKNLKETHILKNSKHIPHKATFPELQVKLREWI